MRYQEQGELHLDFHGTTAATINYIMKKFGCDALQTLMTRMAQLVYRDIYTKLQAGNTEALVEHWQYFFQREHGNFHITRHHDGSIELEVKECPAIRQLHAIGMTVPPDFCRQTQMMNDAWSENTPFAITTEKTGECSCIQTILPKEEKA